QTVLLMQWTQDGAEEERRWREPQHQAPRPGGDQEIPRTVIRAPIGGGERGRAGLGLPGEDVELRRERSRHSGAPHEPGLIGSLWRAGRAGDADEELLGVAARDRREQRWGDGGEGERQARGEAGLSEVVVPPLYDLEPPDAGVEAELAELPADPLVERREEPALVGAGTEMRDVVLL